MNLKSLTFGTIIEGIHSNIPMETATNTIACVDLH
jgi:hypothetical protein